MITIFLVFDNELSCARYIYKHDNFYILTVIVTNLDLWNVKNKYKMVHTTEPHSMSKGVM
jgi:hypothetical protein